MFRDRINRALNPLFYIVLQIVRLQPVSLRRVIARIKNCLLPLQNWENYY
jgi:hypothetical protein